ncbi:MAG: NUDIX hydrolase [Actinomycetales bacterium]|nr:NUDIX hydrolase [Actinomycetales bacterium]
MQPNLAISTVIFALRPDENGRNTLMIPLVKRIREPHLGKWALPGGPLVGNESLDEAAARNLRETTGLTPRYLEQLYSFGAPERSAGAAAERVVSIVYWALVGTDEADRAVESENVHWLAADCLPELAFDHNLIVEYALWRLRAKLNYSRVAHGFLGEEFTLAQLREVYEIVLGRPLDKGNFRRSVEASGAIIPTGRVVAGASNRPPALYTYDKTRSLADRGPLNKPSDY